ncbi:hypothetical protein [Azospirillum brasilense]|uniref:hypothetical protein n=1 Tax=Azospirillum brasilense TaxID=192 RepID=UPI001586ABFC|nr:hypothetical protein [Azospirillum brasilense]
MGFSAASDRPGRLICFLEKVFFAPANIIQKTNRNPYCQSLVLIPWRELGVGVKAVLKPVNRLHFAKFADEIRENTRRILGSASVGAPPGPGLWKKGSCAQGAGRATVALQARLSG